MEWYECQVLTKALCIIVRVTPDGNIGGLTQGEIRRFRISETLRKSDGSSFRHISGGRKHVRAK